jgi:hypothetical protein
MRRFARVLAVLTVLMLGAWQSALALRCHGKIVSVGDRKFYVRDVCGEPTYVEEHTYALPSIVFHPHNHTFSERTTYVVDEVWTYDFGSGRLIYLLTFRHGKVARIDTAEHR